MITLKSEHGQSEWLLNLVEHLQITTGSIFEAGAKLPQGGSNAIPFLSKGFRCILVEREETYFAEWSKLSNINASVHNISIPYREDGLNQVLNQIVDNNPIIVLFLDIDGGEYFLLRGLKDFRPKFICVEVDNGFPLNIDYIPSTIRHGMHGGQASALSTYKLLKSMGYVYLNSFWQDMVFVDSQFLGEIRSQLPDHLLYGTSAFVTYAHRSIYNPFVVLLNQAESQPASGLNFYITKFDSLIGNGQISAANALLNTLLPTLNALPALLISRSEHYRENLMGAVEKFMKRYSYLLDR